MPVHFYEPARGHGLKHDPFNAIVGPRPIGWLSTVSRDGVPNLAPYSFFNAFNYAPPIVGFASLGYKDTVRNAAETGEFVWNLATRALAEAMNETSRALPPEVDEFARAGLETLPSRLVRPARVARSPVHLECRLAEIVQLKSAAGRAVDSWLVLGEVVGVHIDERFLPDGVYDTAGPRPILRAGGPGGYAEIAPEAMFDLPRPG